MPCCCNQTPFTCAQCRCQTSFPYEWLLSVAFDAGDRCFSAPSGAQTFTYGIIRPFTYSGSISISGRTPIFPGPCNYADGIATTTTHRITARAYIEPVPGQAQCYISVDFSVQQRHDVTVNVCGSSLTRTFTRNASLSGAIQSPGLASPCIGSQYAIALSGNSTAPGVLINYDVVCPGVGIVEDIYNFANAACDNSLITATATLTL